MQVPRGGAPDSVDVGADREPRVHRYLDRLDCDTDFLYTCSHHSRRGEHFDIVERFLILPGDADHIYIPIERMMISRLFVCLFSLVLRARALGIIALRCYNKNSP